MTTDRRCMTGWRRGGCRRHTTPRCATGTRARASASTGTKAQIAVDTDSQIITAVAVLAGNAADNEGTLALVEASEECTEAEVAETVADCAFGDGQTRAAFAEAGRELVAKVPAMRNRGRFPKTAFAIDLEAQTRSEERRVGKECR